MYTYISFLLYALNKCIITIRMTHCFWSISRHSNHHRIVNQVYGVNFIKFYQSDWYNIPTYCTLFITHLVICKREKSKILKIVFFSWSIAWSRSCFFFLGRKRVFFTLSLNLSVINPTSCFYLYFVPACRLRFGGSNWSRSSNSSLTMINRIECSWIWWK